VEIPAERFTRTRAPGIHAGGTGSEAAKTMQTDEMTRKLYSILLQLAKGQDKLAATEAAATPYWATCPPTVVGHRTAATLLRAEADRLATAS
jgi:hypothetical protein